MDLGDRRPLDVGQGEPTTIMMAELPSAAEIQEASIELRQPLQPGGDVTAGGEECHAPSGGAGNIWIRLAKIDVMGAIELAFVTKFESLVEDACHASRSLLRDDVAKPGAAIVSTTTPSSGRVSRPRLVREPWIALD